MEKSLLGITGYISAITYYLCVYFEYDEHAYTVLLLTLIVLMAIYVFVVFSKLKIKNNQLINRLASTMFGVYLIHDSTIIRPLLWQKRFHWIVHYNSLGVIPYSIAVVLVVYGVCSLIDILRQETVERLYLHIAKRCSPKVTELFQRTSDWFTEFFFGE